MRDVNTINIHIPNRLGYCEEKRKKTPQNLNDLKPLRLFLAHIRFITGCLWALLPIVLTPGLKLNKKPLPGTLKVTQNER